MYSGSAAGAAVRVRTPGTGCPYSRRCREYSRFFFLRRRGSGTTTTGHAAVDYPLSGETTNFVVHRPLAVAPEHDQVGLGSSGADRLARHAALTTPAPPAGRWRPRPPPRRRTCRASAARAPAPCCAGSPRSGTGCRPGRRRHGIDGARAPSTNRPAPGPLATSPSRVERRSRRPGAWWWMSETGQGMRRGLAFLTSPEHYRGHVHKWRHYRKAR